MTATEKKYTVKKSYMEIGGVLFLTAGYGRRDEPLSLVRPKALLPFGETSVLGRLISQVLPLCPEKVRINASRCPEVLFRELVSVWQEEKCELYFEERPLGSTATIARHVDIMNKGTWMIINTDMIIEDFDAVELLNHHRSEGADWTVLAGSFPQDGTYSPLLVNDDMQFGCCGTNEVHYWGVSIMEPSIPSIAARKQASQGMFGELASAASAEGCKLIASSGTGRWLDMGSIDTLRSNILYGGSFVHPTACISSDVSLIGSWNIGRGCILGSGAVLKDSVMLEGSSLEGGSLEESILPWFCTNLDGEAV